MAPVEDDPTDQGTLSTISLLESRLLRIEHILYGPAASYPPPAHHESAVRRMADAERRLSVMVSNVRVYGELLKIYRAHPSFFHTPPAGEPPSQLPTDAVRSIVLASASSFTATLSSLTAIKDCPIPDASASTTLVSFEKRIKAIEATQLAQTADVAMLRRRSEAVVRSWYEGTLLSSSRSVAEVQGRMERVERQARRKERAREEEKQI
ncbi:hypothetical protein RJ55_02139 [Drechmeria coniospora]|nr:hypothetical protein RJ55_02139 [Drechmeria coniospora]